MRQVLPFWKAKRDLGKRQGLAGWGRPVRKGVYRGVGLASFDNAMSFLRIL